MANADLAASESSCTTAVAVRVTTGAALAATVSSGTTALAVTVTTGAALAATLNTDTSALVAEVTTGAALAATEVSAASALAAIVTTGAALASSVTWDRSEINHTAVSTFSGRAAAIVRFGRLLYEDLPLRTSGALGNFADEFVLAHRYGDLTSGRFKLERLDDKTFFAADHPMAIADVFVDNQKTAGWEQQTRTGGGHTWTVVVLSAPAPDGAQLSATGTGKRNPKTGALIENTADIAEDAMRIAGRDDLWWDQLRAESGAAGLRLAGSLDQVLSIQAWLNLIMKSAGAIWAPGMARLYPISTISGYRASYDKQKVRIVKASANLDNTCDILRVYYDPDTAGRKSQRYVEMKASPMLYGGMAREERFDWLRTSQNAESVCRRYLEWFGGKRWDVEFPCADRKIAPGQWSTLQSIPGWQIEGDPTVMVMGTTPDEESKTVACTGVAVLSVPTVTVTAHSVALPTTRDAGVEVAVKDGVATIVVKDKEDRPVLGARVNVDGGAAKTTDANGVVRFPATPGPHRVAIQAPGKKTLIIPAMLF
jgi:hypothetical protein